MSSSSSKPSKSTTRRWNWTRGEVIGHGTHGVVSLATLINSNGVRTQMAVKTVVLEHSSSLRKEKRILEAFRGSPEIVTCHSSKESFEGSQKFYNLLLEYASAGTLENLIAESDSGLLPENDVREYTKMILKGLDSIHAKGYVHCDIKPKNILAFPNKSKGDHSCKYQLKIADFGAAMEPGQKLRKEAWKGRVRGTMLYMSPESMLEGEIGPALDVWSLGCTFSKMVTGESPWRRMLPKEYTHTDFMDFLAHKTLEIPESMSEPGKDFLSKCLVRDPRKRWSARMLLDHPYITGSDFEAPKLLTPYEFVKDVFGRS